MRKALFLALLAVVVGIGLLHFFTPAHLLFYHNTYRRLSYFPIVMGGLWFGVRGGLTLALLSSLAFIPHVLLFMGKGHQAILGELMEILLYVAAGVLVGAIAGKQTRLKEQYRELSEKLQRSYRRLHEETEQLIEAEKQLAAAQKFSALGQMAASLAHEIKNPLSSIKGTTEILLDDYPAGHPKREFVDILVKETTRLNSTVEEVLRYSRQKQESQEVSPELLLGVMQHVVSLVEQQRREKGLEIHLPYDSSASDFVVDGHKISQVFLNLMLNAIDASPAGGTIRVSAMVDDDGCTFAVCDQGEGVDDADKEKIFEPFFSGKKEGTGLGLLISGKIVASYGGTISVTDLESGGACFSVFLPANGGMPEQLSLGSEQGEQNKI